MQTGIHVLSACGMNFITYHTHYFIFIHGAIISWICSMVKFYFHKIDKIVSGSSYKTLKLCYNSIFTKVSKNHILWVRADTIFIIYLELCHLHIATYLMHMEYNLFCICGSLWVPRRFWMASVGEVFPSTRETSKHMISNWWHFIGTYQKYHL